MSFEPVKTGKGHPRVRCICDDCGRDEVVGAVHGRRGDAGAGQAAAKVQRLGWSYIGKRLRCAACERKRKFGGVARMGIQMKDNQMTGTQSKTRGRTAKTRAQVAPEPEAASRAQKREILSLLEEVYDVGVGAYLRGDTDDTVAEVLSVRPGWVAALREEFFGPSGENAEMKALSADIEAFLATAKDDLQATRQALVQIETRVREAEGLRGRLERIKQAVGPRLLRGAQ